MKRFLPDLKKGTPVGSKGVREGLLRMAKALERMGVHNGRIQWANGIPTIIVEMEEGEDGDAREIDGSITDPAGVNVSGITDINVGVYHLGNYIEMDTSLGTGTYWLKIDLATTGGTPEDACSIVYYDPSGDNILAYKLLTVDGEGKALLYRGAWTEYDGSNVDIRFTQITAPDVPLGTIRMWDDLPATIPIGWGEYTALSARFPVGLGGEDYTSIGQEGGFKAHGKSENNHPDHDLSHYHEKSVETETSPSFSTCGCGMTSIDYLADIDVSGVEEWTGAGGYGVKPNPVEHGGSCSEWGGDDTDNRPPYSTILFIKREAV